MERALQHPCLETHVRNDKQTLRGSLKGQKALQLLRARDLR